MHTAAVDHSDSLEQATTRFLDDLQAWVESCIDRYADAPPTDVHDQLTFTVPWSVLIQHRQHRPALAFKRKQRDAVRKHFVDSGRWHHGYWRKQEVHHGTEHFQLFLTSLWLDEPPGESDDSMTQLVDVAEHCVNGVDGIPDWYVESTGLYRSAWLGTEFIGCGPGDEINTPDHLRLVGLCRTASLGRASMGRLQTVADAYTARWAEPIMAGTIPRFLLPANVDSNALHDRAYARFAGMAGDLSEAIDRAENLLASDAVGAFCWQDRFVEAARKLLFTMIGEIGDPAAGPLADAVRRFRVDHPDPALDAAVSAAVADVDPMTIKSVGIEPIVKRDRRPSGVGKRTDMPEWFEDGRRRRVNPITLYVAGEIEQDDGKRVAAVDLARTYFNLAREVYPDGREHGCSARSVSAIARGHGRDNNAGMVTAVLAPALEAAADL